MQLFLHAPEHVFMLRGNHEYYIEYRGRIYGGVKPAEAITHLIGHMPDEMFVAYMNLFESLPNVLVFDRVLLRTRRNPARFHPAGEMARPLEPQRPGDPLPDALE